MMRMFRMTAAVMLFATGFSFAEPVVGALRDTSLHSDLLQAEINASVLAHASNTSTAADAASPQSSRSTHFHGTEADHCSHVHGMSLRASLSFELAAAEIRISAHDLPVEFGTSIAVQARPPRS